MEEIDSRARCSGLAQRASYLIGVVWEVETLVCYSGQMRCHQLHRGTSRTINPLQGLFTASDYSRDSSLQFELLTEFDAQVNMCTRTI